MIFENGDYVCSVNRYSDKTYIKVTKDTCEWAGIFDDDLEDLYLELNDIIEKSDSNVTAVFKFAESSYSYKNKIIKFTLNKVQIGISNDLLFMMVKQLQNEVQDLRGKLNKILILK